MSDRTIRPARPEEHSLISDLALRSKAHWGYAPEFLEACRAELTYNAEDCGSGRLWVAVLGGIVAGFSFVEGPPPDGELAALFVDPRTIGMGIGTLLLEYTIRKATSLGYTRLELDADPQAEGFYLHLGARRIGTSPSGSIPGRKLPRLAFDLAESARL